MASETHDIHDTRDTRDTQDVTPTEGTRADQERIANLETLLAHALSDIARLRTERLRYAAETERLRGEVARLRRSAEDTAKRRAR